MRRFVPVIVLLLVLVPTSVGQDEGSQRSPRVLLVLPSGVASETVQINYFMSGPFGGYGGFVRAEKNRPNYNIEASVDGQPAAGIRIIAYLPGCEIVSLDIPVQGPTMERRLLCKSQGSIPLRGQIFPVSITQEQPTEVEVVYLAYWSLRFFGIADGPVTRIRIAAVRPDDQGQFEVKLPDLYRQTNLGDGAFQFILRHTNSGNIVAFLRPAEAGTNSNSLKVRSAYEPLVQFMAERP